MVFAIHVRILFLPTSLLSSLLVANEVINCPPFKKTKSAGLGLLSSVGFRERAPKPSLEWGGGDVKETATMRAFSSAWGV